jgi:hypothetical protein
MDGNPCLIKDGKASAASGHARRLHHNVRNPAINMDNLPQSQDDNKSPDNADAALKPFDSEWYSTKEICALHGETFRIPA